MSSILGVMSSLTQSVKPSNAANAGAVKDQNGKDGTDNKSKGGHGKGKGAPPLMEGAPTFADAQSMPTLEELDEWMPPAGREERRKAARLQGPRTTAYHNQLMELPKGREKGGTLGSCL